MKYVENCNGNRAIEREKISQTLGKVNVLSIDTFRNGKMDREKKKINCRFHQN